MLLSSTCIDVLLLSVLVRPVLAGCSKFWAGRAPFCDGNCKCKDYCPNGKCRALDRCSYEGQCDIAVNASATNYTHTLLQLVGDGGFCWFGSRKRLCQCCRADIQDSEACRPTQVVKTCSGFLITCYSMTQDRRLCSSYVCGACVGLNSNEPGPLTPGFPGPGYLGTFPFTGTSEPCERGHGEL